MASATGRSRRPSPVVGLGGSRHRQGPGGGSHGSPLPPPRRARCARGLRRGRGRRGARWRTSGSGRARRPDRARPPQGRGAARRRGDRSRGGARGARSPRRSSSSRPASGACASSSACWRRPASTRPGGGRWIHPASGCVTWTGRRISPARRPGSSRRG